MPTERKRALRKRKNLSINACEPDELTHQELRLVLQGHAGYSLRSYSGASLAYPAILRAFLT